MKALYVADSDIEGKGIFATKAIKKGEHIAFIIGKRVHKKTTSKTDAQSIPLWYGITEEEWIDPSDTIWRYMNHSCAPNAAIVGTKKLIAIRPIKKDTELTIDYSMTDGDLLWDMSCKCNTRHCRHIIYSIQRVPEAAFQRHMPFIPKYFVKLRNRFLKSATIKNDVKRRPHPST